jgi:putative transposase
MTGNCHVRFGGRPRGKGPAQQAPRRAADPTRTVREQFLVELGVPGALAAVSDLSRLNELFAGWVETVYHQRVHSETGQGPLARFLAPGPPVLPSPQMLHEAFLWSHLRTVTKTATISLHGNR